MVKTNHGKKKKSEKTVYTYKEYVDELRPKSLGRIENSEKDPTNCYERITLQKDCALPHLHPTHRR